MDFFSLASDEIGRKIDKMNYYADKIIEIGKCVDDKEKFDRWSIYELRERADMLKTAHGKHEQKSMAKQAEATMNDDERKAFFLECGKIDDIFVKSKAKIEQQIDFRKNNPDALVIQAAEIVENSKAKDERKRIVRLTPFAGGIGNWFNFYDEIKSKLCDNNELSDELKMIEMVQAITPELLNALGTVGFENTWKKLCDMYNDKYKLSQFFIQKMFALRKIDGSAVDNIEHLLNEATTIENAFERIGDVSKETMTMFSIVNALDAETARAWKRYRNTLAESYAQATDKEKHSFMPSLESLCKFLKDERDIYISDMIEAQSFQKQCNIGNASDAPTKSAINMRQYMQSEATPSTSTQTMQAANLNPSNMICILCVNGSCHPLFRCPKFLAKQIMDRVKIISEHRLCIRCFRPEHPDRCSDSRSNLPCGRCKPDTVFHNSTLCDKNTFTVAPIKKVVVTEDDDDWN